MKRYVVPSINNCIFEIRKKYIMAKIGDTVRFLNSVGGGKLVRIEGNIAYVDDDGFETPVLLKECVVVDSPKAPATAYNTPVPAATQSKYIEPEQPKELPVVETPEGDRINVVIAYQPSNLKSLNDSYFETYLVNDSNYYMYFTYMSKNDSGWLTRYHGLVEPNIQVHLERISHDDLSDLSRIAIQYIPFKTGKSFDIKNPVSIEQRLDTTKFYKLHCFRDNEYFDSPVISFEIVKNDVPNLPVYINTAELEKELKTKKFNDQPHKKPVVKKKKPQNEIIECDLHINELIDTTSGLTNADMLEIQLNEFNRVMTENQNHKGAKIVFIHGKGEGVLRKAILEELKKKYNRCEAQDASFREYGFGATLVTIR